MAGPIFPIILSMIYAFLLFSSLYILIWIRFFAILYYKKIVNSYFSSISAPAFLIYHIFLRWNFTTCLFEETSNSARFKESLYPLIYLKLTITKARQSSFIFCSVSRPHHQNVFISVTWSQLNFKSNLKVFETIKWNILAYLSFNQRQILAYLVF